MPIKRLLKEGQLKPDEIERLNRAFNHALRSLSLVDRNDPLTELVAKRVIEIGLTGVIDPKDYAAILIAGDCTACGRRGAEVRPDLNWNSAPVAMMGYR